MLTVENVYASCELRLIAAAFHVLVRGVSGLVWVCVCAIYINESFAISPFSIGTSQPATAYVTRHLVINSKLYKLRYEKPTIATFD